MSNLENLTSKIVADGDLKAKTILADAKREAEALIAKAEQEATAESRRTLAAAEDEAKKVVELALSSKKIAIRDKALSAKQQTIARALDDAKAKLAAMDKPAYEAFLWRYLGEAELSPGETLQVPAAYKDIDMDALNAKLAAAGKPTLTLDTQANAANGFKLIKNDIENDNSFDALIDYYRVTLEQLVVEALFHEP